MSQSDNFKSGLDHKWLAAGAILITLGGFTAFAEPVTVLELKGTAEKKDGSFFAVMTDIGIVEEGDEVLMTIPGGTERLEVVTITKTTLTYKTIEQIMDDVEPEPGEVEVEAPPSQQTYDGPRNPFWPIGHVPEE